MQETFFKNEEKFRCYSCHNILKISNYFEKGQNTKLAACSGAITTEDLGHV